MIDLSLAVIGTISYGQESQVKVYTEANRKPLLSSPDFGRWKTKKLKPGKGNHSITKTFA